MTCAYEVKVYNNLRFIIRNICREKSPFLEDTRKHELHFRRLKTAFYRCSV